MPPGPPLPLGSLGSSHCGTAAFQCSPCPACLTRSPEAGLRGGEPDPRLGMKGPLFSRSEAKFERWLMFSIVCPVPKKSCNKQAWSNTDPSHPIWVPTEESQIGIFQEESNVLARLPVPPTSQTKPLLRGLSALEQAKQK